MLAYCPRHSGLSGHQAIVKEFHTTKEMYANKKLLQRSEADRNTVALLLYWCSQPLHKSGFDSGGSEGWH